MKSIFASRTLWANVIALLATVATLMGADVGMDAETQGALLAGVMAVVNIVLRVVTKEPVKVV